MQMRETRVPRSCPRGPKSNRVPSAIANQAIRLSLPASPETILAGPWTCCESRNRLEWLAATSSP
eukprot:5466385-Alexandrium_andersonii.AAC.1